MSGSDFWARLRDAHLGRVLLVYAGASWATLEATDFFITRFGLAESFLPVALVLLLIGLIVIVVTALVQARPAEGFRSLFNWRNALVGGAFAFGLWGVVATSWLLVSGGRDRGASAGEAEVIESIAVLPFTDLSPQADQEYFSDGLSEDLLTILTRVPGLKVAARTSAFAFRGRNVDVREVGEALGVGKVLEGSVRKSGDRVRVTAQLINVSDGFQVWSETYDRELTDILVIQDEIAQSIVDALKVTLSGDAEEDLVQASTSNVAAYNDYLRGRYHWNRRTLTELDSAIHYFNRAVLLDPDYARAYGALGESFVLLPEYGGPTIPEVRPYAKAAIERALALDPGLAEAYVASGYFKTVFEWDRAGAEQDYQRAIALNPDYATAHQWYAELLSVLRRREEAYVEAQRAYQLDPLSPAVNLISGMSLELTGQHEAAIARYRTAIELAPDLAVAHHILAEAYLDVARYEEALAVLNRLAELRGEGHEAYEIYIAALKDPGLTSRAVETLWSTNVYGFFDQADYFARLGRIEECLQALERKFEERNPYLPWVNALPRFEGLRSDPRFRRFLATLGF
jgi:TolB-like protein/Flp pilus assembly protein TadD